MLSYLLLAKHAERQQHNIDVAQLREGVLEEGVVRFHQVGVEEHRLRRAQRPPA